MFHKQPASNQPALRTKFVKQLLELNHLQEEVTM